MGKLQLNILTPEEEFLKAEVDGVNFTCKDGCYEILPGHTPIAMSIVSGVISYLSDGTWHEIWSTDGIAKVNHDEVVVFTNRCALAEGKLTLDEKRHYAMMENERESIYQHEESKISITRAITGLSKKSKRIL